MIFEQMFLKIRREDDYWLDAQLDKYASKILDSFFLDIDAFNPEELYDVDDPFNINEAELKIRASEILNKLTSLLNT